MRELTLLTGSKLDVHRIICFYDNVEGKTKEKILVDRSLREVDFSVRKLSFLTELLYSRPATLPMFIANCGFIGDDKLRQPLL